MVLPRESHSREIRSKNKSVDENVETGTKSKAFLQTDLFLVYLFFCERKAVLVQWRQLVSCNWSWYSHGSLIPGKFDPKINRSMKTLRQEYSGVSCSYSSAPGSVDYIHDYNSNDMPAFWTSQINCPKPKIRKVPDICNRLEKSWGNCCLYIWARGQKASFV